VAVHRHRRPSWRSGLSVLGYWIFAAIAWVLLVFVVQFFRDPARTSPDGAAVVLSPADGRVVLVGKARDPYLDRDALKISVFMNVFNVHSKPKPGRRQGRQPLVLPRELRQRGARQGVARERAQRRCTSAPPKATT
jgi:hypothetical protein